MQTRVALMILVLFATSAPATSLKNYRPGERDQNEIVLSPNGSYCVEIQRPRGVGGCLAPNAAEEWNQRYMVPEEAVVIPYEIEELDRRLKEELERNDWAKRIAVCRREPSGFELLRQFIVPSDFWFAAISDRGELMLASSDWSDEGSARLYDVSGQKIADLPLSTFIEASDLMDHIQWRWGFRVDDGTSHRIIFVTVDASFRSDKKPRFVDVEYDVDEGRCSFRRCRFSHLGWWSQRLTSMETEVAPG